MGPTVPFETKDGRPGVVRVARPRDARAFLRLAAEAVRERPRTLLVVEEELWSPRAWRRHRRNWGPTGVTLAAEVSGKVVGSCDADRGRRAAVRHQAEFGIIVARSHRDLGVGRALIGAVEGWAAVHGVERMVLGVFPDNERARALYGALGYREEGIERGAARFSDGETDIVRMAKTIPGRPTPAPPAPARPRQGRVDTMSPGSETKE